MVYELGLNHWAYNKIFAALFCHLLAFTVTKVLDLIKRRVLQVQNEQ